MDATWADVVEFSKMPIAWEEEIIPSYNICPTQLANVIVADDGHSAIARRMRWGLIPSWSKDNKRAASAINARVETVASKPTFRAAWKARRCLVPASGYYEWRLENGIKQPYWIHDAVESVLMFGGLWENWRDADGETVHSFSIITQDAVDDMHELHDRTPLMLPREVLLDWIHGSAEQAGQIAASVPLPDLAWHPVDRAVSSPRSQGHQLTEAVGSE
ncbi:hypothetical protein N789_14305 [Arenimonas oryziterrae DSM 21050 = YC6267]|uniref:Abasic site processing protein n=2 Tax=Arenimonas TaxID=490567 RepID=A0A091AT69_9GAMM|nr:hypothetical protein N789_14305 [Arenimonas oryziterrae DSM 21050 = YC6267]